MAQPAAVFSPCQTDRNHVSAGDQKNQKTKRTAGFVLLFDNIIIPGHGVRISSSSMCILQVALCSKKPLDSHQEGGVQYVHHVPAGDS